MKSCITEYRRNKTSEQEILKSKEKQILLDQQTSQVVDK
jgi:hypothetical protein